VLFFQEIVRDRAACLLTHALKRLHHVHLGVRRIKFVCKLDLSACKLDKRLTIKRKCLVNGTV
jgi:hypothetical protein